jgi:hypothetical protein
MKMSFQSLLQQDGEDQRWAGNGWGSSHGSHRLRAGAEEASFVQDGVLRNGGGGGGGRGSAGGYRGELVPSLTLNTSGGSGSGSGSGYGADLTLFSPSDLFSPPSRLQQVSSPFNWQSLLGGGQGSGRWQPDTPLSGFAAFGASEPGSEQASLVIAYAQAEENVKRVGGSGDVQNDLCQARDSSGSDGVMSEVEVDPSGEVKEEWTNNVNPEKENWRKFGGMILTFR